MFDKIRKIAMIAVTTCLLMITVGLLNQRRVSAQTCSPAPVDLASWWSGDGNALDSRSRSNGILVGDTNFVPGQVGQAFNFDGADDSVQIPHNPNQNIQGSFTAEAWVFPRSSPNISPRIFDKSNGGGFWIMATGNGVTSNTLHVNINNAILLTAGSVPLNQWTHVAFTYDVAGPTGGLNLYVNGVLLTSQTASVQTTNDTGPLRIGNEATNVRDFDGLIDEAQIYNRALSDSEILATVNAGTAGHCKPTATVAPSGLAAWWAGDGNTNDISGNGNNGTLQGGAGFSVGKVGQTFSLNANTDSGISVPNSPSLNPTDAITMEAWVNPSTFPNGGPAVIRKDTNPGTTQYGLLVGDGTTAGVAHCNIGGIGPVGGSVPLNQWTHLACTYDRQNIRLYVNGLQVAVAAATQLIPTGAGNILIGKEEGFSDRNFDGLIDEPTIYNRALTTDELTSMFNAGLAGKLKTATTPPGTNVNTNVGSDATVTFANVSTAGTTQQIPLDPSALPVLPSGFTSVGLTYDIATGAGISGNTNICFNLPAISDPNVFSHLKVLHSEGGSLIDRTTGQDFSTRTLCGNVPSLSPFVIAQNPSVPTAAPATISGTVTGPDGSPVGGVVIRLSGQRSAVTITNSSGKYHFDNVDTDNFYTVTPFRANYHFAPASRSFSLLANETDAVFTANPDAVFTANALDTPEYFVRQHYLDFLGREPDDSGFNFWSDQITSCGSDFDCLERRRINVSAAYFLSIEFQQTGGLVDGLYRASYGRRPFFIEFMPDTAGIAQNVIVGSGDWERQLTANKATFIDAFVQRSSFRSVYDNLTDDAYVNTLIANTGVSYSQSEREALVNGLTGGTLTRAAVLRQVAENERFIRAKFNQAFVMMEYFGYLRRDPDESGYQFWLAKLNQFNGNFEQAEMVKAFIVSGEYRARFH